MFSRSDTGNGSAFAFRPLPVLLLPFLAESIEFTSKLPIVFAAALAPSPVIPVAAAVAVSIDFDSPFARVKPFIAYFLICQSL
jgi:hypothetical protein